MTNIRTFILTAAASLLLGASAFGQDADGNDTPGDWVTDHYENFGIFVSACDSATRKGKLVKRCYIRHVDVFSESPKFGAVFVFVFQKDRKTAFEYAFEKGTIYAKDGIRVERGGKTVWTASAKCQATPKCHLETGPELDAVLNALSGGGELVHDFTDRHGKKQLLRWDLTDFDKALADYNKQSIARDALAG